MAFDEASNGDGGASLEDLIRINVVPSELFLKFRKELQGFRLGLNLEFFHSEVNEYEAKMVLKPLMPDQRWKFMYEPIHGNIRLMSKKIPVAKYLNIQIGIGHNIRDSVTGLNWKLSTCLGGYGTSHITNKTTIGLFPGFDLRIGWQAEYVLPEIHGAVGNAEPIFDMKHGRFHASLDRVEAILTHAT